MDIELPNDWGITKRQHHHQQKFQSVDLLMENVQANDAMLKADRPKHLKRKKNYDEPSGNVVVSDEIPLPPAAAQSSDTVIAKQSDHSLKISKGPLGPRAVFNAITHDVPEKGQLKQIVMTQLMSASSEKRSLSNSNNNAKKGGRQETQQKDKDDDMLKALDEESYENHNHEESFLQMEVHCLLSKLPYQKMISDLFIHHDKELLPSPAIPYVTKAYEESFMREPLNSTERLCAKGEHCECMFIDLQNPFTCIEFLLPGEKQPSTPHLCVVCCRAVTQQLYYDIMFDKHDFGGVIQRFGNIHSQPGEYSLDAMLIAAPNVPLQIMPLPIVSHQRNRYSVFVKHGIKHLKQSRVYFQITPSC
jgi:hypothetical protein